MGPKQSLPKMPSTSDAEVVITSMDSVDGYHPNKFMNRKQRRHFAKRAKIFKNREWDTFQNGRGDNTQTMRRK